MEKAVVYQALKLIEQLYMDGHLSQEMYNLILEDYKTQAENVVMSLAGRNGTKQMLEFSMGTFAIMQSEQEV